MIGESEPPCGLDLVAAGGRQCVVGQAFGVATQSVVEISRTEVVFFLGNMPMSTGVISLGVPVRVPDDVFKLAHIAAEAVIVEDIDRILEQHLAAKGRDFTCELLVEVVGQHFDVAFPVAHGGSSMIINVSRS